MSINQLATVIAATIIDHPTWEIDDVHEYLVELGFSNADLEPAARAIAEAIFMNRS